MQLPSGPGHHRLETSDQRPLNVYFTPSYAHRMDYFSIRPQGCVVIFLSYFVALLIKIDVAQDTHLEALGMFLVAVNLLLVLAVLWTSWFAIRQIASDSDNKENTSSSAE